MGSRSSVLASRFLVAVFATSSAVGLVVACSADGGGDALLELESAEAGTEPVEASVLPPSSRPEDASDAAKDSGKDASKDAAKESGVVDAGKPAPSPGDPCTKVDEIFTRKCGACGTQQSLCFAGPDGGPGVVGEYSFCTGELADGCLPGTSEDEVCGNCGTRKRTCTQFCEWSTGTCTGEPAGSCTPTLVDYTTASCPVAGTVRTRSCGATCTWSPLSGSCEPLSFKLVVGGAPGATVSAIYPLRAAMAEKRLTGTCPNGSLSTTTDHPNAYVELVNPTADTLTLSAWNTEATSAGPIIDTVMGWYAGATKPTDDASRKACTKGMNDACPAGLPCGGNIKWAGLTGTNAITIPPLGSVLVYFGSYYATSSTSPTEGNVKLVVRTDGTL